MTVQAFRAQEQGTLALVDDDAALRHALAFSFETHGFKVASFGDAETALAAPDIDAWRCLVLDLKLPGMSGLDLLDHLRARRLIFPAVLITSNPTHATRARARVVGVDIIEKPLLDDVLVRRVRDLWST